MLWKNTTQELFSMKMVILLPSEKLYFSKYTDPHTDLSDAVGTCIPLLKPLLLFFQFVLPLKILSVLFLRCHFQVMQYHISSQAMHEPLLFISKLALKLKLTADPVLNEILFA